MLVLKFGGTSVSHADGAWNAVEIVAERLKCKPTIIVSALVGVTRELFRATRAAIRNDRISYLRIAGTIERQHADLAEQLLGPRSSFCKSYSDLLADGMHTVRSMLESLAVLRELTPRARDAMAAIGLRLSASLFTVTLHVRGIRAELARAEDIVKMRERFWFSTPDIDVTRKQVRRILLPLLRKRVVPVMAGCVGTEITDGYVLLLGENGADRSATIVGAAIGADEVQLWGDVDGLYTCDPEIVPNARLINSLSFGEAAELGHFGATDHRLTFEPLTTIGLPVRVLNTYNPESQGTLITTNIHHTPGPRAISCRKARAIAHMTAGAPLTIPQLAGLLNSLMQLFVRLEIVALSDTSLTLMLPEDSSEDLGGQLRLIGEHATLAVEFFNDCRILTVIGQNLAGDAAARASVAHAMAGVPIKMALPGRSAATISVVVDERDAGALARKIHNSLFESAIS